jgi:hypothetical protein
MAKGFQERELIDAILEKNSSKISQMLFLYPEIELETISNEVNVKEKNNVVIFVDL